MRLSGGPGHRPTVQAAGASLVPVAALAVALTVVLGCTGATGVPAGGGAAPSGGATTGSSPGGPSSTTAPPVASTTLPGPAPIGTVPPDALLSGDGGAGVAGALGSYTWGDGGSDAPWLPGAATSASPGGELTVALTADAEVVEWRARYGASRGPEAGAITGLGQGSGPIAFPAPPRGSWTVALDLRFADELGSATYYWRIEVP